MSTFSQSPYRCRVEWGQRGAREAAERGDITIIVDVLSFSSTVVTAVNVGAIIFPHPPPLNEQARTYAGQKGAELILGRAEAARLGKPSLSPGSFGPVHSGKKFVLCSLNGAACTWIASKVPALLIGCLLNASAVAEMANRLQLETGADITIVPCGEQWNHVQDGENLLRPSMEDYLGAGAILAELKGSKSPEAEVCIGAFHHAEPNIRELIWDCGSGRELRERGFEEDVRHCARLNVYQAVPLWFHDHFVNAFGNRE
ncbi:2-phosphosulfolactate phosphatase [Lihuaxuella thermophila]|uniref:Probable 2-phosphosulfolactate phosphatase n=1 Tax=Lihuaxuella thermophila TaxID=1173111 RepID=A0A1H8C4X7_9BACL|nr:2-phosphosulfolactate phosphatase [Lihuaxuella thermophila]SEM90135.1 2-phosphosulfolactate phosphatase [Lihuaxuella thermophila]